MKLKVKERKRESKYSRLVKSFDDLTRIKEKVDVEKSSFVNIENNQSKL